ncbi:MAG: DUF4325 domain-containing protein [Proteobacteria bacterium]|nr:DUF4325 domain-containing protein [Pseudomonadota bacterium]
MSALVETGTVIKTGSTRNAHYEINPHPLKPVRHPHQKKIHLIKKTKGLEEDRVYTEVCRILDLLRFISPHVQTLFGYAFTEILNNAIDHSLSSQVIISVEIFPKEIEFRITDKGIGIFKNIQKSFRLKNEWEAVEHLLKGKQTTLPKRHSGEGIFFTSKIADLFEIKSHSLTLSFDNRKKDIFIKERRFQKGTEVTFRVLRRSRKSLSEVFQKFTNANFEFDRNEIRVKVSSQLGNLSRSEAKRLLLGLDKFKRITFDFKGVKEIGQGFADELFRVFPGAHSRIQVGYENAIPPVEFMIRRSLRLSKH